MIPSNTTSRVFFYVYILESLIDGKNYIGYTENLKRRIKEHEHGYNFSTKFRHPFKLIYYEACLSQKDAKRREKYLKSTQGRRFTGLRLLEYNVNRRLAREVDILGMKNQKGYAVLIVMIFVSVILLAFSFWVIRRRTNIPQPVAPVVTETESADEWVDFDNNQYGVKFQYPRNIFTANTNTNQAGMVTRIFLGSADVGTITVAVFNRQFDPKKIVNESDQAVSNATALNVAGQIGYQYQDQAYDCARKVVQAPLSHQTLVMIFASCSGATTPQLVVNQDLILRILNSVKLNFAATESTVKQFSILADDDGASPSLIEAKAGDLVQITISVSSTNVAGGRLEFRSAPANTGAIVSGTSKTITFTADESFELIPYWPSIGINNNYTIKVDVVL